MKFQGNVLHSKNVQRLVEFYSFISNEKGEGDVTHYSFENLDLAIWNSGNVTDLRNENLTIMYKVDDCNFLYKLILGSKYSNLILNKPTKKPWGVVSFQVQDPDGNTLSFLSDMS